MKHILIATEEQELGLTYVAEKEKQTPEEYIQTVFSHVLDKYVKQMREDEGNLVKDEFVKTGVWQNIEVIKSKATETAEDLIPQEKIDGN